MCFDLTINTKTARPTRAKEDITVFKAIKRNGKGIYFNLYINGKPDKWVRGTHYYETTPFRSKYTINNQLTVEGHCFHSSIEKRRARIHLEGSATMIVEMIIPKGALYFKNHTEYVSSEIIYPLK